MPTKKGTLAGRAWRLLRLALLWARKGGALGRRLMLDLRLASSHLKNLRTSVGHSGRIHYGEREFSLDETPTFHFKMHRPASMRLPRIPCIQPPTNFDDDEDEILCNGYRESFLQCEDKDINVDGDGGYDYGDYGLESGLSCEMEEAQGIDSRAEEFIARFYEQMKLQRQASIVKYNEMLHRGIS